MSQGAVPSVVTRTPVPVMFLSAPDEVEKFGPLWPVLEGIVGLRGRKFYGAFYALAHEYRVCVQTRAGDDAALLGLETCELPGGNFLRLRLRGEAPAIYEHIGPTFARLESMGEVDRDRPGIEFYRSHGEIDCLMPILESRADRVG